MGTDNVPTAPASTAELRRAASAHIELVGYRRRPANEVGPAVRGVQVGDNLLPRGDAYAALCYAAGVIQLGPCGWAYDDRNPMWGGLITEAYEELTTEVGCHFDLWARGQTPEVIVSRLRGGS